MNQYVLNQNGGYLHTLPNSHQWTHINDSGDAIALVFHPVSAANGQPAYQRQEILLTIAGNTPQAHPLPSTPENPYYFQIVSFLNDRKLHLKLSVRNSIRFLS